MVSPDVIMAIVLMTVNHVYAIEQQALTTFLVLVVIVITSLLLLAANCVQDKIGAYGITVIS
jgi:multiple antibiotic resistance protein